MINSGLLWRTVRHLTVRQAVYQLLHRLRSRLGWHRIRLRLPKTSPPGYWLTMAAVDKPVSFRANTFTCLAQSVSFSERIDWNYRDNGKLWTYQLNYFDFLNQPGLKQQEGLYLIRDFMAQTDSLRDGLEPYPTSLRVLNWVQFLSYHRIQNKTINAHLFAQTDGLSRRFEYHLAGNHLLENAFALLIGALYFRHKRWFQMATKLLRSELTRQILADGGHDERSPMYHQLLLGRMLTVRLALHHDRWHNDPDFGAFLTKKVGQMLDWLHAITFRNGDVPMVNDAAFRMAPTTAQLQARADQLVAAGLPVGTSRSVHTENKLTASGYRLFRSDMSAGFTYELFVDVGAVGPDHQPGHAHADTFSFVLYVDNQPIIVDSGTATYQPGPRRTWERSTAAHNTVEINGASSSEVWAGFRVGRRARVKVLTDTATALTARHDGYRRFGISHQRTWLPGQDQIRLVDQLLGVHNPVPAGRTGVARFYFHPDVQPRVSGDVVVAEPLQISFESVTKLNFNVIRCDVADGFNRLASGHCLTVLFMDSLETTITRTQCAYST